MLPLIILDKKSCTLANVDFYLKLLIEELQTLWIVVEAHEVYLGMCFKLKAMCIWNMHDFAVYGLFIRCVTKGHRGHLICSLNTKSKSSKKYIKMVYCASCRYLPKSHLDRWIHIAFDGKTKTRSTPLHIIAIECEVTFCPSTIGSMR